MTAQPAEECRRRPNSRWTKCRCPDCAHDQYRLDKQRRTQGGVWRIPPEDGWAAFCALLDAGWSTAAIGSACGIDPKLLDDAARKRDTGGWRRFGHNICLALLNPGTPTAGHVPALGSMRRLRALARVGWTTKAVAEAAGVSATALRDVRAGRQAQVQAVNAEAVTGAYERLSGRCGPSSRAVFRADREGWPQPYRWDGLDMDDPAVTPLGYGRCDGVKVSQRRR